MSVLIKGMAMPETCEKCMFCKWSNLHQTGACTLHDWEPTGADFSEDYLSKRADWCPLVEIPSKHGDLIDRDNVESRAALFERFTGIRLNQLYDFVGSEKAVIEAEGDT